MFRKSLFLFIIFLGYLQVYATSIDKKAKELVALLSAMEEREKIVPDSFFSDVHLLRTCIANETDSAAKNIYRATLAHFLVINAHRSQSYRNATPSHPDSIKEWSQEEYREHAAQLYSQSLADMELLHSTSSKAWLPVLHKGKDENVFASDMLSVVWHAMKKDFPTSQRVKEKMPSEANLIAFYHTKGLYEAELLLVLDSLSETSFDYAQRKEALLRLKHRFQHIPACALVYLKLSELEKPLLNNSAEERNKIKEEQLSWINEGLRLYPSYKKQSALRNRARWLQRAQLRGAFNSLYYPQTHVETPIYVSNMLQMTCRIYRVPQNFKLQGDVKDHSSQVRKAGRLLKTIRHRFESHLPTEEWTDTLHWKTPGYGRFAVLLEGKTKADLDGKSVSEVALFEVTSLASLFTFLPDGILRVVAVDAHSGEPQEKVAVDFYSYKNGKEELLTQRVTATNGRADLLLGNNLRIPDIRVRLSRNEDCASTSRSVFGNFYRAPMEPDTIQHVRVFTDRAIYRPGQKVHIAAVAYKQKDWDARVMSGRKYTLLFYDVNRQLLQKKELTTDEYGTVADTLLLPERCLPGEYMIRVGAQITWIKVEEYKRPTFRVEMHKAPSFQWNTDSIILTGRAVTYSGVPIRHARVTSTMKWQSNYWLRIYNDTSSPEQLDTVRTDHNGGFAIRVPVKRNAEQMKRGQWLSLMVDVLSENGETQQGETQVHFCSEPLRLHADVPLQQLKEQLKPWTLKLFSSTEEPINASISCSLLSEKSEHRFVLQAGIPQIPKGLDNLPSGKYILRAMAKVGNDSVLYETSIILFSEKDTRLALDSALWTCAINDTFAIDKPAKIQIGTALKEAWLHCLLVSTNGVLLDSTLYLRDSVLLCEIPYKKEYRHGIRAIVSLFHKGEMLSHSMALKYREPEKRLRMHWDVFRNLTRPGAREEWRLSLRRPDGVPAKANVLVSLYDASLEAMAQHQLRLFVTSSHRIPFVRTNATTGFWGNQNVASLLMNVKQIKNEGYVFSLFNEKIFPTLAIEEFTTPSGKPIFAKSRNVSAKMGTSFSDNINETAGGLVTDVEDSNEKQNALLQHVNNAPLRENMQELAFFMPQLRTDSKGQTSLAFTLPESMTSWRLTGFAHTKDMLSVSIEETIVAQKELMAELHLPRFLRVGDTLSISASIRNISSKIQKGSAVMQLWDAHNDKLLQTFSVCFDLSSQTDTTYQVQVKADGTSNLLAIQWKASSEACSDGEKRLLPVLSDVQLFSATKAFSINGPQMERIDFKSLFPLPESQAKIHSLTIEYTSHPQWFAIQCLPSLSMPLRQDALSLVSAYYAGALAHFLAENNKVVRDALSTFSTHQQDVSSTLHDNQKLANLLLQETPWVMQAYKEKCRKEQVAKLLKTETYHNCAMENLSALKRLQQTDGSFAWYPGMRGSSYLTSEVALLLARLQKLTQNDCSDASIEVAQELLQRAIGYMQKEVHKEVDAAKNKKEDYRLSTMAMQYLYVMSMQQVYDIEAQKDIEFLLSHLQLQSNDYKRDSRAFVAMLLHLYGMHNKAEELLPELRKLLIHSDGAYLAYPSGSFVSIDRKIQSHVLMLETFQLIVPKDTELIQSMQQWLLQQKRTQEWEQPLQTANAVYALLWNDDLDLTDGIRDDLKAFGSGKSYKITSEDTYLGVVRKEINLTSHIPSILDVKKNTSGVSWGAVHLQYTAPLKNVMSQHEGLNIQRQVLSKEWEVGDRVQIRYVITADRDYEFVRLSMPRVSGAEPSSQLSGYVWKNGLGYYRANRDTGAECFIDHLPKGTYVIEEEYLMSNIGVYQWAPAIIQCLYAPEYQARTSSEMIKLR